MNPRSRLEGALAWAFVALATLAGGLLGRASGPAGPAVLVYWCLAAWHLVH